MYEKNCEKKKQILNHFADSGQMQYQPTLVVTTLVAKVSVHS